MTKIDFDPEHHVYTVNGKRLPSVTEICAPLTAADMAKLSPALISAAANRGSLVHELTELIDYGTAPDDLEMYAALVPYITAYQRFLRDYRPRWQRIEYRLASEKDGFAGTLDRLGVIDDRPAIVDIKTTSAATRPTKVSWVAQLSGYRRLCGDAALDRYVLLLKPNGRYSFYNSLDIEKKYSFWGADLFANLLSMHEILKGE